MADFLPTASQRLGHFDRRELILPNRKILQLDGLQASLERTARKLNSECALPVAYSLLPWERRPAMERTSLPGWWQTLLANIERLPLVRRGS